MSKYRRHHVTRWLGGVCGSPIYRVDSATVSVDKPTPRDKFDLMGF